MDKLQPKVCPVFNGRTSIQLPGQSYPSEDAPPRRQGVLPFGAGTDQVVRVGRYRLIGQLGSGGMADSWLAHLEGIRGFSRTLVIKTLKPEFVSSPEFQTMFNDEARIGAMLDHPNIPKVEELGEEQNIPYMVQQFVDGPSVYRIRRRCPDLHKHHAFACGVAIGVASALHHAYFRAVNPKGQRLAVIHRDISPSNVLVSAKGVVKLIDFGVAHYQRKEAVTKVGALKGKIQYMAPEVVLDKVYSHRSDLYALGVLLYALVVGRDLWPAEAGMRDRLTGDFPRPREVRPEVPEGLERIILKLLEHDPADRYPSGESLIEDLEAWLASAGLASNHQVNAGFITSWFPNGRKEWSSPLTLDGSQTITQVSSQSGSPMVRVAGPSKVWLGLVAVAALVFGVGLLNAWWSLSQDVAHQTQTAPGLAPVPADASEGTNQARGAAAALLAQAKTDLVRGDLTSLDQALASLDQMAVTSDVLLAERLDLAQRRSVLQKIRDIRALLTTQPTQAMVLMEQLVALEPDNPAVADLKAEVLRAQQDPPASTPSKPKPRAKPETAKDHGMRGQR